LDCGTSIGKNTEWIAGMLMLRQLQFNSTDDRDWVYRVNPAAGRVFEAMSDFSQEVLR
jgi:hypothetical protein